GAMTGPAAPVRSVVGVSRAISRGRGFSARRERLFELSMSIVDRSGLGACAFGARVFGAGGNCARTVERSVGCRCTAGGGVGVASTGDPPVTGSDATGAREEDEED